MIDHRIDLTIHNDFSVSGNMPILTGVFLNEERMTSEQYETIVYWESIFGKRRHDAQKYEIFANGKYKRRPDRYCKECGTELRVPWKRFYGRCKRCDETTKFGYCKIPWKRYVDASAEGDLTVGSRGQNLFDLR